MALPTPNLDDRKFQDIVREARTKIPQYCPKWTDYNLSDPGITLIELFSWMVDMLLFRMNRVPEKNYIKFMELIGIRLQPPHPAACNITFRLSAAQPEKVVIPKGTEVATVRTETQDAVTFTTDKDLTILVPELAYAVTTAGDSTYLDVFSTLRNPDILATIFEDVPKENNALYLGYKDDLKSHTLVLSLECNVEGIGVDPRDPPLRWEYWQGEQAKWLPLRVESDSTGGLNKNGQVVLHIPADSTMKEIESKYATWIRCRAIQPRPTQRPYTSSPRIKTLVSECLGGTVPARHALRIMNQVLGRSDGTPSQKFFLQNLPVLPREAGEYVEIETSTPGLFEPWHEVSDFSGCGPDETCYTCDSVSGEIKFGPVIRSTTGSERRYGKIPAAGSLIRFTCYRCGGGITGNVGEGTISILKSSIPYVASITNFEAAAGGTDTESLEEAKLRVPETLRARTRAVTADDFEYFALQASPLVARSRCLTAGTLANGQTVPPGTVRLLIVPGVPEENQSPIPPKALELTKHLKEELQAYLDERRLLATNLVITTPEYQPVDVVANIKAKPGVELRQVQAEIENRLYKYINPVRGGQDGQGLSFGRSLSLSDVYATIHGISGVEYIDEIKLFPVDPKTGERLETTTKVTIPANTLICSHKHEIVVEYHSIN
jgi:predicted phage baseplate assembly protein